MRPPQLQAARAVVRLAREVSRIAGPTEAARQVAYALVPLSALERLTSLCVLASRAAKGEWSLPPVADIEHRLARFPVARARLAALPPARRRPRHAASRERLPLEAARAVPIATVCDRLGLELVGEHHVRLALCPWHDDHRPDLKVDLRKNLVWCPVCDRGADGIGLVMSICNLSFADAVRWMA